MIPKKKKKERHLGNREAAAHRHSLDRLNAIKKKRASAPATIKQGYKTAYG